MEENTKKGAKCVCQWKIWEN